MVVKLLDYAWQHKWGSLRDDHAGGDGDIGGRYWLWWCWWRGIKGILYIKKVQDQIDNDGSDAVDLEENGADEPVSAEKRKLVVVLFRSHLRNNGDRFRRHPFFKMKFVSEWLGLIICSTTLGTSFHFNFHNGLRDMTHPVPSLHYTTVTLLWSPWNHIALLQ